MPISTGCTAVALNGKIYVMGNIGGNPFYEYDPATNSWTEKKSLPTSRISFAMTACQNKIYVIGGSVKISENNYAKTALNEVYNPQTNSWETKTEMSTKRSYMEANTVDGKIYVIGGRTGEQYTTVDYNEVYDPATDSWSTKAPITYPVVKYASAVLDGKIYVMGGQDEYHSPMNAGFNQIYDVETNTWSQGTTVPNPALTSAAAASTLGIDAPKRVYFIGGASGLASYASSNYAYDPQTNQWTTCAPIKSGRLGHGVAVVNDLVYAFGGTVGWLQSTASVEQYTPDGYGTIPATIGIIYPETKTYTANEIPLEFTISKHSAWMGYSLDGQNNVTVSSNSTLKQLPEGNHNITVYATDAKGNTGASITKHFDIKLFDQPLQQNDTPSDSSIDFVVIAAIAVTAVGVTFVICYKKLRKHV